MFSRRPYPRMNRGRVSVPVASGGDIIAPTLVSIVANAAGTTVTLTYNEALDAASQPATTAYTLAGTSSTVASLNVTGSTVVLTLNTAAYQHETITLTYVVPGVNPVQDVAGNDAVAFAGQAVTNNIAARAADPVAIMAAHTPFFFLSGDLGITIATGVSAWADQSSAGKNATQGTGANQPTYNATGLNGHGIVTGDGSNDLLVFTTLDLPAPGTTNIWIFAVFRQHTWTTNDSLYGGGATSVRLFDSASTPEMRANNTTSGPVNTAAVLNTWVRLENLFKNAVGDYLKLGATSVTGTNTGNTDPTANVFSLLSHVAGAGIDADLACIGAWQLEASASEKNFLNTWTTNYYGGSVAV